MEGAVAPIPDGDSSRLSRVQGEEGGAGMGFTQTEPCGATPAGRGGGCLAGCGVTWRWTAGGHRAAYGVDACMRPYLGSLRHTRACRSLI